MYRHLYELVQERARAYPETIALGSQEGLLWRTITSRELLDRVDWLAAELARAGVREGDRVVLWLPSHWRTPVYFFALWKLGAVVVPFDREMNPEAGAKIFAALAPRCTLVGYGERPAWARETDLVEWWEPGSRLGADRPAVSGPPPAEELAAVVYTSGTTGTPKGCMITHANLCSQVEALRATIPLDSSCRLASVLPLSHLFELTVGLLYPLALGAAIHYVPSRRGPEIVRVFAEQRITHMLGVPQLLTLMGQAADERLRTALPGPVYRAMVALAPRLPLAARRRLFWPVHHKLGGHVRLFVSGGAGLPVEVQQLWERFGVQVVQGYGTSECSPVIAGAVADGSTPAGSVGKALPGVEVRLSDEGELLVRGPNVMRGYWKDPERTAEVLRDGWYATGDLAHIDANGNLWLQGRARDLIKLPSGMAVWPQDVEDVLREHPTVKDAAVVAVPGAGGGATLHAYLLPRGGGQEDLAAIVATCNGRLAQHQRLATASWWPEPDFPRTTMLKVRRHLLPLPDTGQTVKVESTLATDDPVGLAIAGVARASVVLPEQTLAALGLDSLGLVELAQALEDKTGKAVADADLSLDMTVEQVRAFLASAPDLTAEARPDLRGLAALNAAPPRWLYTWGRAFHLLALPFDLLYHVAVPRTIVLGAEHLADLPPQVIFAGTHHSFADMPVVRYALARSAAREHGRRLVVAIGAEGFTKAGLYATYGILAFGLHPILQHADREASLRRLVHAAGRANSILIFPQGTHADPARERAGDPALDFRPGTTLLAEALDAPVVPFGLAGTETVMLPYPPPGFKGPVIYNIPIWLRRRPLAIAFGPPLRLAPGEAPQPFTARLQAACYALTRQAEQALKAFYPDSTTVSPRSNEPVSGTIVTPRG